jgi:hypothetical protein
VASPESGIWVYRDPDAVSPYGPKRPVEATVVAVLQGTTDLRGLALEVFRSRAVRRHEVHELMVTDEAVGPGGQADRVGLIAFVEIGTGGVVVIGDDVTVGDRHLGVVAGFDQTHAPNHLNVVVRTDVVIDGVSSGVRLGDEVRLG